MGTTREGIERDFRLITVTLLTRYCRDIDWRRIGNSRHGDAAIQQYCLIEAIRILFARADTQPTGVLANEYANLAFVLDDWLSPHLDNSNAVIKIAFKMIEFAFFAACGRTPITSQEGLAFHFQQFEAAFLDRNRDRRKLANVVAHIFSVY